MIIPTRDTSGNPNGWLMPLWNAAEGQGEALRPDQVYLSAIAPGCDKGPHLHMVREQRYYCIRGIVEVIWREEDEVDFGTHGSTASPSTRATRHAYGRKLLKPGSEPLVIAPGVPSQLRNMDSEEAWIINMPSPPWTPQQPDDWPVEDWNP